MVTTDGVPITKEATTCPRPPTDSTTAMADISALLPPYLNLPPHLSGHKYFFVCTLTIAAWDTLVLSPRSWRLLKTKEWPVLKIVYQFLRYLMPVEFIAVGVAFFDTKFTRGMCDKFYMFEPICTMLLLAMCSAVHVIRIYAIFDKSRPILAALSALLLLQVSVRPTDSFAFRIISSTRLLPPFIPDRASVPGYYHRLFHSR